MAFVDISPTAEAERRSIQIEKTETEQPGSSIRRRLIISLVVIAAASGAAIPLYVRYYGEPRRFAVVEEGVLYRSGQPRYGEIDHLANKVGIKTIVVARENLSDRVPDEITYAEKLGVRVIHIPARSRTPLPADQIQAFFRIVDDPDNRPILVHCSAGRHRTGLLCGLYRVERQGWSVEKAVAEMQSFEPDMDPQRPVLNQLKQHTPGSLSRSAETGP